MLRPVRWLSLGTLLLVLSVAPSAAAQPAVETWARAQARSLLAQGNAALASGDVSGATRLFHESVTMDGSFEDAYLALGALRERSGDAAEAERTYAVALEHLPGASSTHLARGRLRWRLGRHAEARDDLAAALAIRPDDLALRSELIDRSVEDGDFPRALALSRGARRQLERSGDEAALARVRLRIKALSALVGQADPLRAGHRGATATRRSIEAIARARGL